MNSHYSSSQMVSNNCDRHAYMIVCHNNFILLSKLVNALDDNRNDIFIHIDKKAKNVPFDLIRNSLKAANLFFIRRKNINWGGDSQISVEMDLLREATKSPHCYYHLLSGVDFPLKSQEEIHAFFHLNLGKQYIQIDNDLKRKNEFENRVRYYYPFQNLIGRNPGKIVALYYYLQCFLLHIQKLIRIDRVKRFQCEIKKGANWFSITHELAIEILQKERYIRKFFSCGLCADELFIQTIANSSSFQKDIVGYNMRMIDWKRGNPYIFTVDDFDSLIHCDKLFARKFDESIDLVVIDKLLEHMHTEK